MEYVVKVRRATCDMWQAHKAVNEAVLIEVLNYFLQLGYFVEVQQARRA
jgi:hypothetical protein